MSDRERGKSSRTIRVDALARVEGEGSLRVRVKDNAVADLQFGIFEPPRFFEALLQGRLFADAPDITARICGICPVAYLLGASLAMENLSGVHVNGSLRDLRRLIYCGEWIESHALHVFMLHLPDFLGYQGSIELAGSHPELVNAGLRIKKSGNQILEVIGGRSIHPVNLRVGGFYRAPRKGEIRTLLEPLKRSIDDILASITFFARLDVPDFEHDYTFVALHHPEEYAITEGRIVSNRGLDLAVFEFEDHFQERQVAHSNALQGHMKGGGAYLVGPLARYNLNSSQLSPAAQEAAAELGLGTVCRNPFQSLAVRAVEILYALEEALRLAENYEEPDSACLEVAPREGRGYGCTEAPRGICYHRYELGADGRIRQARIVPPTSQNQEQIEDDLRGVVQQNLHLPDAQLQWRCEQTIRNYDPCISCATHFLRLTIDRE